MLLTNCAACAAPLAHDAPWCVRCKTRYCDSTCQHDHWRRGHKQICKKVHRGGNAEQYHANNKYKEAIAVAVEECADDTKGQKCYICLEAVHSRTREGLVRGCTCGDRDGVASPELGVAHVSCLAEQAKILVAEAEENNLSDQAFDVMWGRWQACGLCEQNYHGVVRCALGWACWKTYVGRPEEDAFRGFAMTELGNGLTEAGRHEESLNVKEAELASQLRFGASESAIIRTKANMAVTLYYLDKHTEALALERVVLARTKELSGSSDEDTIMAALNLASTLNTLKQPAEARQCVNIFLPRRPHWDPSMT